VKLLVDSRNNQILKLFFYGYLLSSFYTIAGLELISIIIFKFKDFFMNKPKENTPLFKKEVFHITS